MLITAGRNTSLTEATSMCLCNDTDSTPWPTLYAPQGEGKAVVEDVEATVPTKRIIVWRLALLKVRAVASNTATMKHIPFARASTR